MNVNIIKERNLRAVMHKRSALLMDTGDIFATGSGSVLDRLVQTNRFALVE